MAQHLTNRFVLGQRIKAKVVELQVGNQFLVSFQEHLIRVTNHSEKVIRLGDVLDLHVSSLIPLEFRIYQRTKSFDRII